MLRCDQPGMKIYDNRYNHIYYRKFRVKGSFRKINVYNANRPGLDKLKNFSCAADNNTENSDY